MYQHFFEVNYSHQVENGLRQRSTVKIAITTSDNLPSAVDKETAVQMAKKRLAGKKLFDLKMGKPERVMTQRISNV